MCRLAARVTHVFDEPVSALVIPACALVPAFAELELACRWIVAALLDFEHPIRPAEQRNATQRNILHIQQVLASYTWCWTAS